MFSQNLTHGSLFSGIGGLDLGFERAGFVTSWQVDNDRFCQAVLKTHFPNAQLFSDVRECGQHNLSSVDVISAGFPCQDVSTVGKRAGLGGEQTNLFFEVIRIARELKPDWLVLENVLGLLSSNAGRDFAVILSSLAALGYFVAYRVLDSQFFGVAQRRRRVFIVGSLREGGAAEAGIIRRAKSWRKRLAEPILKDLERIASYPALSPPARTSSSRRSPIKSSNNRSAAHLLILRRLTPTECEMLQGFPKGWTVPDTAHWAMPSRYRLRSGLGSD
jgi:DNA (cytosine-5)-methyltransferase 1